MMNFHQSLFHRMNILKERLRSPSPELKLTLRSLLISTLPGGALSTELIIQLCDYLFDKHQEKNEDQLLKELERLNLSHEELLATLQRSIMTLNAHSLVDATNEPEQAVLTQTSRQSTSSPSKTQVSQPDLIELGEQKIKMCLCPSGTFWMGSERGVGDLDEQPRHQVYLSKSFKLSDTLITQSAWHQIMETSPSKYHGDERRPVERISWFDALLFCNKLSALFNFDAVYELNLQTKQLISIHKNALGYRLPSEAEWEYAAKASTELIYAGSHHLSDVAVRDQRKPPRVKSALPNQWGLYDMTGLLWVWCIDAMSMSAYQERCLHVVDPINLSFSRDARVIRGGSWDDPDELCRVAARNSEIATKHSPFIGLRIAQTKR